MTIQDAKKIYCVGIGGIGVSGLARLFHAMGKTVAGSDLRKSQITEGLEKLGIKILTGQDESDLEGFVPDLVVYSSDVTNYTFPKDIKALTQAEAIGELMDGQFGIGVTGTNGKSTTTAILGLILEQTGLDPSVLVGSMLAPKNESERFKANARLGEGKYFVAESDEYQRKMLQNKPQMIVLTNIALDHLDYYKNLEDIKSAFLEYVQSLPDDGILIYNADDHSAVDVCKHARSHKFTFGIHHYADLQALNIKSEPGAQTFDLHYDDAKIGNFSLQVPGLFNVSNAIGAALAAMKLGVKPEVIQKVFREYASIWRRFEKVGELQGKIVISDYAHHPDALVGTIAAAKEFFPGKKILYVFQPHHRNRTKMLFTEFVDSLVTVDLPAMPRSELNDNAWQAGNLIISEIFDVTGREHGEQISSLQLVKELNKQGDKATFAKDLDEAEKLILAQIKDVDVVLMMGAGDIDNLARKLVK